MFCSCSCLAINITHGYCRSYKTQGSSDKLSYHANKWYSICLLGLEFIRPTISNNILSIQYLKSCIIYLKPFLSGWLHATRFFQSIGLLMSLASFVSSLCCTFVNITDRKRHAQVAAAVINFVTGILTQ